jgi:hypothetical protein
MTPIEMDLTGVEAWKGGGLTSGTHTCVIDEVSEGTSSGGYDQIELLLRSIDGPESGGKIRDWVVVNERTMGKVRALLEAAQIPVPEGTFRLDSSKLLGKVLAVIVRDEQHNGATRPRVQAYAPVNWAGDIPVDTTGLGNGSSVHGSDPDIPF